MARKGATALPVSGILDQLCDMILAKLSDPETRQLPSKQWVVRSSRTRDAN